MIGRPEPDEYSAYNPAYVDAVPEDDILGVLGLQAAEFELLVSRIPASREHHRYADGKWSVREVVGHLGDGERVFGYRAVCISRGEQAALPKFDENRYVETAGFDEWPLPTLASEFLHLRAANVAALQRLDVTGWRRMGTASGKPCSVRALAYIMAGHVRHHVKILADRYGVS